MLRFTPDATYQCYVESETNTKPNRIETNVKQNRNKCETE